MKAQRKWLYAWGKCNWMAIERKNLLPMLAAASFFLSTLSCTYASPAGGQVITGDGTISQYGNEMTIRQVTEKIVINWQRFNVSTGESVHFVQPGASSIALNRVVGNDISSICGTFTANGTVFLVNPLGIVFSPTAQVNVSGLLASTLDILNEDFLSGSYRFSRGKGGSIVNRGIITAANGGYVAFLGERIANEGIITANQGAVLFGAGSGAVIDFYLYSITVDQSTRQVFSVNSGLIQADGGKVLMTARAADALVGTVVNNGGVIQARTLRKVNGTVILDGGANESVEVSGLIDVSGKETGQTGGRVNIFGGEIALSGNTRIDASGVNGGGDILIGGNSQGNGPAINARKTTINTGASIQADGLAQGDGGRVVVWADTINKFQGYVSARGGATSGNGGNVEVEAKEYLIYKGVSDLTATNGATGSLLLNAGFIEGPYLNGPPPTIPGNVYLSAIASASNPIFGKEIDLGLHWSLPYNHYAGGAGPLYTIVEKESNSN